MIRLTFRYLFNSFTFILLLKSVGEKVCVHCMCLEDTFEWYILLNCIHFAIYCTHYAKTN